MNTDKTLLQSKKARALGVALLNLNVIFFISAFSEVNIDVVTHMITAVLFLVGIYTGVQGGIDMVQSSKLESVKSESTNTLITKNYEYKMDYVEDGK